MTASVESAVAADFFFPQFERVSPGEVDAVDVVQLVDQDDFSYGVYPTAEAAQDTPVYQRRHEVLKIQTRPLFFPVGNQRRFIASLAEVGVGGWRPRHLLDWPQLTPEQERNGETGCLIGSWTLSLQEDLLTRAEALAWVANENRDLWEELQQDNSPLDYSSNWAVALEIGCCNDFLELTVYHHSNGVSLANADLQIAIRLVSATDAEKRVVALLE